MDVDEVEFRDGNSSDEDEGGADDGDGGSGAMEVDNEEIDAAQALHNIGLEVRIGLDALLAQRRVQRQQSLEMDDEAAETAVSSGASPSAQPLRDVDEPPSDAVKKALEALRTEAAMEDMLPLLNNAEEDLIEYLFRCPVPRRRPGERGLDDDLRQRAVTWVLVLDFVNQHLAGEVDQIPEDPNEVVQQVGHTAPHKVCQHVFKKNDIVWICKNCQKDETCVLCNNCFEHSRHEGHEVYFYHTQAGGCCDCGDEDAWEPSGFCERHGKEGDDPLSHLPPQFVAAGRRVLRSAVEFLLKVAEAVVQSFELTDVTTRPWGGKDARYYLMVHHGDTCSKRDLREALARGMSMSDSAAREYGEQAAQTGDAVVYDGDLTDLIAHAERLRGMGIIASVTTKRLYKMVKVALSHVQWLHQLAGVSGGFCRMVVEQLDPGALEKLMLAHGRLPRKLAMALHTLYLFLMADQSFKAQVAHAYATTYLQVSEDFGRGLGVAEYSLYTLSVQFLNRSTFVNDLVVHKDFLSVLCKALRDMVEVKTATLPPLSRGLVAHEDRLFGFLQVDHMVYQHRRYSPIISDLKFVLNIPGVAARFSASPCLDAWLSILFHLQYLHAQNRETRAHVEYEPKNWMYAFNIQISLCHVLDCLLLWARDADPHTPHTPETPRVDVFATKVIAELETWQANLFKCGGEVFGKGATSVKALLYPSGEMDLVKLPTRRSFHVPLHRVLAVLLREVFRNAKLAPPGPGSLPEILSRITSNRRLVQGIAEISLSVLVLSSEIRSGLWRRNGHSMLDQVVNYAEAPFCRIFRDLDVLLVQCAGVMFGAREMVNLILHRFHVHGWLLKTDGGLTYADTQGHGSPIDRSPSTLLLLAEEALHLQIIMITELPLPPMEHMERTKLMLHREVVHRLVSGPCTYSELQECCHQFMEANETVLEHVLEGILNDVAVRREARELEPEKFVLKDNAWSAYDPAFYHISVQAHQHATEFRPKPKSPAPLAPAPLAAHPFLAPLRMEMLASETLIEVVRVILRDAIDHSKGSVSGSRQFSDLLVFRALHLLTLAVHAAEAAQSDQDVRARVRLFELLRAEQPQKAGGGNGQKGARKRSEAPTDGKSDLAAAEDVAAGSNGGLLAMLLALPDVPSVKADSHMLQAVRWILDRAEKLDSRCAAVVQGSRQQTASAARVHDAEARKRQARERLLSQMQKSAATFLSRTADGADDGDMDEDADKMAIAGASIDSKAGPPECMACRGVREGGTLGYAGFCQRSSILSRAGPAPTHPKRRESLVLQLCGHALHYECFDGFFTTVVEQSESIGHLVYDVVLREFPCPLCKAISNVLVPYVPEPSSTVSSDKKPEATAAADDGLATGEDVAGPTDSILKPLPDDSCTYRGSMLFSPAPRTAETATMATSPVRPRGPTAVDLEAQVIVGNAEGKSVDPDEQALQGAAWSFLADVTRVALQGGPLPKGLGPDSVLMVCEAIAYTLAVTNAEQMSEEGDGKGPAATGAQEGHTPLSRLGWVAATLQHVEGYRGSNALSGDIERVLDGQTEVTRQRAKQEGRNPCSSHSGLLNLSAPLLTQNVWCLLVAAVVDMGVSGGSKRWTVKSLVHGLSLARMLQVLWEAGAVFAVQGGTESEKVQRVLGNEGDDLVKAMAMAGLQLGAAVGAGLVATEELSRLGEKIKGLRGAFEMAVKAQHAFVRCAAALLNTLGDAGMLPDAVERTDHADVQQLISSLEVPDLSGAMRDSRWAPSLKLWVEELAREVPGGDHGGRTFDFPVWEKARFIDLKRSYTELHSHVTDKFERGTMGLPRPPAEHPAVCLACGTALAAGGGECTRHAEVCGQGTSVFFLLQECSVLLVYGPRASYFPSPYVDSYGERHKQYRGRPLFLDERRLEALRKLWASQRVAYEVLKSRGNAKQVIHLNFY